MVHCENQKASEYLNLTKDIAPPPFFHAHFTQKHNRFVHLGHAKVNGNQQIFTRWYYSYRSSSYFPCELPGILGLTIQFDRGRSANLKSGSGSLTPDLSSWHRVMEFSE